MIDVLMITYQSPERTRMSLDRLLDVADESMRVWLWHNGEDEATLEVVRSRLDHRRIHRFHHSIENVRLRPPTNWLLTQADGEYLSKIDDDNVVPLDWPRALVAAHEAEPRFGVLGSWRFQDEDFDPAVAEAKIQAFGGGQRIMRNLWVEGSCFVMKRACVDQQGPLAEGQSFPQYCKALAHLGWINGYYYPFLRYENLDDPRAPHTFIHSDEDLADRLPLSARANGVTTVSEWTEHLRRSAHGVQSAPFELKYWNGWRLLRKRMGRRLRALLGNKRTW
jgi:cellulose synthase/poly-beta-1,6-N-acetylglucosamine synthase-like glycosyltransferase